MSSGLFAVIFPSEQYDIVMGALSPYAASRLCKECSRVRLAALKLAPGNLESLRRHIANAEQDYRDVLVAAEYPEYMRAGGFWVSKLPRKEQRRIINSDWDQYTKWLQQ